MEMSAEKLVQLIAQRVYDRKGFNIMAIDVREVSSITDFLLIAEGNIERHVVAISEDIQDCMREIGEKPFRVEGRENGDWLVLDYLNIMIHLFIPEMREKYQLEKLWSNGKIVDLHIETDKSKSNAI
ncbi:Ribosomal silencing factor RsfS [Chlamydiales bacterium SCGC AG-110-M15]|nr:Ribosomal silencing factor RsfS [Chlamydiales bacterium SCGC AG-110-M15]